MTCLPPPWQDPRQESHNQPELIPAVNDNLKQRMAIGIAWMTAARVAVRLLGLLSMVILARLLSPADFGLVAMATAVAAGLELLTLFGFDVALVQRKSLTRADYDSAWTLNLLLGAGLAVALILVASPAAAYYREPRLEAVLMIIGVKYALLGALNTGTVDFRRNLAFGREFTLQIVPKLAGLLATIPLAFLLRDYRALIAGMVLTAVASFVLSFVMHPHRPKFCLTEAAGLMGFSRWLLANNAIGFVRTRSADFIIGRALGPAALGAYSLAWEISNLPTTELVAPINRVLFPGYVKVADDPLRLRDTFRATLGLIAIVILPASVGLAAVADPLVRVVLGEQWLMTIPLITLLALAGASNVLQVNTGAVHHALGQPRMATMTGLIHLPILLPLLLYGTSQFGLVGAAWAYLIFSVGPGLITTYWIFLRTTPITLSDLLQPSWRPLLATPVMFLLVRELIQQMGPIAGFRDSVAALVVGTMAGAAFYTAVVALLWILAGRPESTEVALVRRATPLWRRFTDAFG